MTDLIDRTALIRLLRDEGLYYSALKHVIDSLPAVEGTAEALARELQADLMRVGRLNESLRTSCAALVEENKALKQRLEAQEELFRDKELHKTICEDCSTVFWAGKTARYCPECRKKRLSDAAKKNGLSQLGCAAVSKARRFNDG